MTGSRAEQYRHLAQECLNLAQAVPPGDSRTTLLDMAREWERLADQQNHGTDLSEGAAPAQQQQQQQQQVHPDDDKKD